MTMWQIIIGISLEVHNTVGPGDECWKIILRGYPWNNPLKEAAKMDQEAHNIEQETKGQKAVAK